MWSSPVSRSRGSGPASTAAEQWIPLGQGPDSAVIVNRPSAIVDDPDQTNTFYESGLYNEGGVYRTTDGGETFERLGDVVNSDLVSVDFTDPARATMLSGRHEEPRLYRTSDGGETWIEISAALPPEIGWAASPHVVDAQRHLLGTRGADASGVLRTADGGQSWDYVYEGNGVVGPVLQSTDGSLYWLLEGGAGIISSSDGGETWTEVVGPGVVSTNASTLLELADGRLASYTDTNVITSDDRGQTWQPINAVLPYTPNGIAYAPEREAFYAWRFDCESGDNPVPADAILRLDVAPAE